MGIRFFCPNGHKLHVKSFLAGKRGYCPKCGVKLLIPEASAATLSTGSSSKSTAAGKPQSADLLPRSTEGSETNGAAAGDGFEEHAGEIRIETDRFAGAPVDESPSDRQVGQEPPRSDPAWYVRPPSGGQYGPATQAEVDRWSEEGRIPPESLVWREGWEDWRTAADTIYAGQEASTRAVADDRYAVEPVESSEQSQWAYQAAKRKKRAVTVILLSLACIALIVVFLIVARPGFG